jgi:hypothetical protein
MVYFHQGEVMSASTPFAEQSLPTLPAQPFRLDLPVRELLREPSSSFSSPTRAGCAPGTAFALLSPAFPPHPKLLHESMPPPTRRSAENRCSAYGSNEKEKKTMTMLAVSGIMIAVIVIAAVVAHPRLSSENRQPIDLGMGRKLRP